MLRLRESLPRGEDFAALLRLSSLPPGTVSRESAALSRALSDRLHYTLPYPASARPVLKGDMPEEAATVLVATDDVAAAS